jgi:hypothetical protein
MGKNDYRGIFDDTLILCRLAAEKGEPSIYLNLGQYKLNRWAHNKLLNKLSMYGFSINQLHYNQYIVSWMFTSPGTEARTLQDICADAMKKKFSAMTITPKKDN